MVLLIAAFVVALIVFSLLRALFVPALMVVGVALSMTGCQANAADSDFPQYSIYNNPHHTPEEEQKFAGDAERDWDSITQAEQRKCLSIQALPVSGTLENPTPLLAPPL